MNEDVGLTIFLLIAVAFVSGVLTHTTLERRADCGEAFMEYLAVENEAQDVQDYYYDLALEECQ